MDVYIPVRQKVVDVMPLTQGIKLLKAATLDLSVDSVLLPIIVMIALAVLCVDYITTKEAARNWGITERMVVYHCSAGWIKGAKKWGTHGLFPPAAEKPVDKRYNINRKSDDGGGNDER